MGIFDRKPNVEKLREKRDVEGLMKALKHKDINVRLGAAEALGRIGDARAEKPLTEVLKDEGFYVQRSAKEALEKIKRALA